jgi:single-stranded DNA-specific DHH superfamily exonuclease
MMNIEKLRAVTDIFSHESCPDGLSSALICQKAYKWLNLSPSIHFIQYDTDFMEKLEPRPNQLFVDITPPKSRWEEWKTVNPIVLDHHDTAKHVTEGLGGTYGDSNESGASLAFKHIYQPLMDFAHVPFDDKDYRHFSELAMIRDTWKKDNPLWPNAASVAHALMFFGSKEMLSNPRGLNELLSIGTTIYNGIESKSKKYARGSYFKTFTRYPGFDGDNETIKIGFFNCTEKLTSDAANYLIDSCGCDIAVGYFYLFEDNQSCCVVSLRSNGKALVNKMAEMAGGGGHPKAAGYRLRGDSIGLVDIRESVGNLLYVSHWRHLNADPALLRQE